MSAKHWSEADFVVTAQTPAYDDSHAVNQFGYCRICKGDMQRFGAAGKQGPLKHYHSHGAAKRAGVWRRAQ